MDKSTTCTVQACFCASCVGSGLSVCAGSACALWLVHPARIQKGQLCLAPDLVRVQGVGCPSSIGIWQGRGVFLFSLYVWCVGTGIPEAGVCRSLTPTISSAPLLYIPELACFLAPPPPFCSAHVRLRFCVHSEKPCFLLCRIGFGGFAYAHLCTLNSHECARPRGVWRRMVPPIPIGWSPSEFIN